MWAAKIQGFRHRVSVVCELQQLLCSTAVDPSLIVIHLGTVTYPNQSSLKIRIGCLSKLQLNSNPVNIYKESLLITVSNSAVPGLVRFFCENEQKQAIFKTGDFQTHKSRFQYYLVPNYCGFAILRACSSFLNFDSKWSLICQTKIEHKNQIQIAATPNLPWYSKLAL